MLIEAEGEDGAACKPDMPVGSGLFAGFDEGVM